MSYHASNIRVSLIVEEDHNDIVPPCIANPEGISTISETFSIPNVCHENIKEALHKWADIIGDIFKERYKDAEPCYFHLKYPEKSGL